MESNKSNLMVDDTTIKGIFGDEIKNPVVKFKEVKYFDLNKYTSKTAKDQAKSSVPKNKMDIVEWFDTLSMEEKVMSVSTIFLKNQDILNNIKELINQVMKDNIDLEGNKYFDHGLYSNSDYLRSQKYGRSSIGGYESLSTYNQVSRGSLSKFITFLDT